MLDIDFSHPSRHPNLNNPHCHDLIWTSETSFNHEDARNCNDWELPVVPPVSAPEYNNDYDYSVEKDAVKYSIFMGGAYVLEKIAIAAITSAPTGGASWLWLFMPA